MEGRQSKAAREETKCRGPADVAFAVVHTISGFGGHPVEAGAIASRGLDFLTDHGT
jgi:hypothetical protein